MSLNVPENSINRIHNIRVCDRIRATRTKNIFSDILQNIFPTLLKEIFELWLFGIIFLPVTVGSPISGEVFVIPCIHLILKSSPLTHIDRFPTVEILSVLNKHTLTALTNWFADETKLSEVPFLFFMRTSKFRSRLGILNISPISASMF